MIYITSKETIEQYFNSPLMSQSQLKTLAHGKDSFLQAKKEDKKMFYEEKGHLILGSLVDIMLTGNEEDLKNLYHISNLANKPSDAMMSIINRVLDLIKLSQQDILGIVSLDKVRESLKGKELKDFPGEILQSLDEHQYSMTWKTETRINKVLEHSEYFKDIYTALGKQVISIEEMIQAKDIVNSLRTNVRTSFYTDRALQESLSEDYDFHYQVPIKFSIQEVNCKALLDLVVVDKKNKTVYPIDFKTFFGYTIDFPVSTMYLRRYDIQAAWYSEALKHKSIFKDYAIQPFRFVVESTKNIGKPLVFECNEELLESGRVGLPELTLENRVIRKKVLGYEPLLEIYKFYNTNGWEEEKIVQESVTKVLEIGINGIIES